jgi:uncharacterized protein with GYD domain
MPVFVSVLKSTPEGNRDIKKARERFEAGKKAVENVGGKIIDAYYVSARGEYLIISEFPNEEARVKTMINTLARGTVTYEVYKALPVEEYFKLVEQA